MTNKLTRGLALAACLVLCLSMSPTAQAAAKSASANGQGQLDGGARHFSFSARTTVDGTTTGHAVLRNTAFDGDDGNAYYAHIDITCMMSYPNNVAVFGGLVSKTNDANLTGAVFFSVQDNGEPGKGVDQLSRAYFWDDDPDTVGDDQACKLTLADDFPREPIEKGNIQVK